MEKREYLKALKHLYQPSPKQVTAVEVPEMAFLMIDGVGDPNTSQAFHDAIETLFALSYTIKFMAKKGPVAIDYGVMPLEGLWWAEDMSSFMSDKSKWQWTLMIMQPELVSDTMVASAIAEVKRKKDPPALARVRFASFDEGLCAQTLHVGPFTEEGPAVEKVHRFIEAEGYQRSGKHHEIYLSDTRRADPAKWKTVIRQPMEAAGPREHR